MNDFAINEDDFADNPTPRIAVVLCLDTSGSMSGEPIRELSEGVSRFYQSVYDDEIARHSAEICIVTFGYGGIMHVADFGAIERDPKLSFFAGGSTPMGAAVLKALDILEKRKQQYKNSGVDYYQPWLVLMTDGAPTDHIGEASKRIFDMVNSKRLSVFPIGIGIDADLDKLAQLSPKRPPVRLKGLEFQKFFEWLSKSVQSVSTSAPGQTVPLDLEGMKEWGKV